MPSADTLQGLEDSGPAVPSVAETLQDVQDLYAVQEEAPLARVQAFSDPEYYEAVLAFAGALMAKGLKVDISFQRGREAVSGEVQDFIQLEART